jgi:hypothetical protein
MMSELSDFLIVIATLIGLFLFNKINKTYIPFILFLLAGSIVELSSYANFDSNVRKTIIYIYIFVANQLMLTLFFSWDKHKYKYKTKLLVRVVFVLLIMADILSFYFYNNITKWGTYLIYLALSIYGLNILNQHSIGFYSRKSTISRTLIIVPFMVFSIYYVTINIVMYFLYNASNQNFFMSLYNLIWVINILSYISYSFALFLAPKKERYLDVT